jgi:hypothetical protein
MYQGYYSGKRLYDLEQMIVVSEKIDIFKETKVP